MSKGAMKIDLCQFLLRAESIIENFKVLLMFYFK